MIHVCTYEIDAADRLVAVDEGWRAFALANGAPHYANASALYGRPLLGFISDPTTRHIYETVFARVRASGRAVDLPFRCDAPAERRWLEMRVTPGGGGALLFETILLRTEPRDAPPIFDRVAAPGGAMVRMCSWCKDVETPGGWMPVERAVTVLHLFGGEVVPEVTHGICPACVDRFEGSNAVRI